MYSMFSKTQSLLYNVITVIGWTWVMLQTNVWWSFYSLPNIRRYHCYYVVLRAYYFIEYARTCTYVFHHDFMHKRREKRTGWQPAVLVRDKIHCNKYPSPRRVMSVVLVSTLPCGLKPLLYTRNHFAELLIMKLCKHGLKLRLYESSR